MTEDGTEQTLAVDSLDLSPDVMTDAGADFGSDAGADFGTDAETDFGTDSEHVSDAGVAADQLSTEATSEPVSEDTAESQLAGDTMGAEDGHQADPTPEPEPTTEPEAPAPRRRRRGRVVAPAGPPGGHAAQPATSAASAD